MNPNSTHLPRPSRECRPTRRKVRLLSGLACLATAAMLAGCGGGSEDVGGRATLGSGGGPNDSQASASMATTLAGVAAAPLSAEEASGLSFMREEEKLAHDVYIALHARWGLNTFSNIASSEQTHMDVMLLLLQRYALPDPAAGSAAGESANPVLQGLYTALVSAGQTSLVAALQAGAEIEELDIRDLRSIKATIDNADLTLAYENLELGSRNHLRAFHTNLLRQGAGYTPKYITQAEYDAIVNSPRESGMP